MLGFLPDKLDFHLETSASGEVTMTFKEWHSYASDEDFQKISEGTNQTIKQLFEHFSELKLEIDVQTIPNEKAYSVTFKGKDIRPAIMAIIGELLPRIIRNEKDAFETLDKIFALVRFCVAFKLVEAKTAGEAAKLMKEESEVIK